MTKAVTAIVRATEFYATGASGLKGSQGFFQEIQPSIKTFRQQSPEMLLPIDLNGFSACFLCLSRWLCQVFTFVQKSASAILSFTVGRHSKVVCINMQLCRTTNSCRTVCSDWTSWILRPCMCSICRKKRRANFPCCVVVTPAAPSVTACALLTATTTPRKIHRSPLSSMPLANGLSKGPPRPQKAFAQFVQSRAACGCACNELGFPLGRATGCTVTKC